MNEDLTYKEWIIWFSGWFDGEGSIIIVPKGKYGSVHIKMSGCSTDFDVVESIYNRLGGSLSGPNYRKTPAGGEAKPIWIWSTGEALKVKKLISEMEPYMSERRKLKMMEALDRHRFAKMPTQEELFWDKVVIQDNGCLIWNAFCDKYGFGTFTPIGANKANRKQAHRFAFELLNGFMPPRLINLCGNKACVHVDHWLSDNKKNREYVMHCQAEDES